MKIPYSKYNGLGNDFILINGCTRPVDHINWKEQSIILCNRHSGIGADGLIIAAPSKIASLKMVIYNSDGSLPEMCGNGIRCLAIYAKKEGLVLTDTFSIETGTGVHHIILKNSHVTVDMKSPILQRSRIPMIGPDQKNVINHSLIIGSKTYHFTAISMGNPHAVIFENNLKSLELSKIGPLIETHSLFPNHINVEFAHINTPDNVTVRVWERGAKETQACGTGACAVVVAGVLTDQLERITTVNLPGGSLQIRWCKETDHVWMTGPVEFEYSDCVVI